MIAQEDCHSQHADLGLILSQAELMSGLELSQSSVETIITIEDHLADVGYQCGGVEEGIISELLVVRDVDPSGLIFLAAKEAGKHGLNISNALGFYVFDNLSSKAEDVTLETIKAVEHCDLASEEKTGWKPVDMWAVFAILAAYPSFILRLLQKLSLCGVKNPTLTIFPLRIELLEKGQGLMLSRTPYQETDLVLVSKSAL
ncbi:MAG TPA: hypothetical protein VEB60_00605 [Candidatus Paceibacterota bacterium]|nr:hypothetical protein [Candidatus Paceibacterota bacterium]